MVIIIKGGSWTSWRGDADVFKTYKEAQIATRYLRKQVGPSVMFIKK